MPDTTTTAPGPTPTAATSTPTLPELSANILAALRSDVARLAGKIQSVGQHLSGDAAALATSLGTVLDVTEKQLGAILQGAAVPAADKFQAFLVAQFAATLPSLIAAAEKAAEAKVVAIAPVVEAAVTGAVTAAEAAL